MSEPRCIGLLVSLAKSCESLFWYWDPRMSGYNTIFGQMECSSWAYSAAASSTYDPRLCGMKLRGRDGHIGGRLIPFFNTSVSSLRVIVWGQGFDVTHREDDPGVDVLLLSALPVKRIHGAVSSSGRYFCCQYIVNLHRSLHIAGERPKEERISLELESRFQQRTEVPGQPESAAPSKDERSERVKFMRQVRKIQTDRYLDNIRGCQQSDDDEDTTYAPTSSLASFRLLQASCAYFGSSCRVIDFLTAFLNGYFESDIYVAVLPGLADLGVSIPPGTVIKPRKVLHVLRQAPRIWWKLISTFPQKLGFSCHVDADVNLFTPRRDKRFVSALLYVDDMCLVGDGSFGHPNTFLNIQIEYLPNGILLHQRRYVQTILDRFQMNGAVSSSPAVHLSHESSSRRRSPFLTGDEVKRYRSIGGALNYLAVSARPDISFALSRLSKLISRSTKTHLEASHKVLRYLQRTNHVGLFYAPAGMASSTMS